VTQALCTSRITPLEVLPDVGIPRADREHSVFNRVTSNAVALDHSCLAAAVRRPGCDAVKCVSYPWRVPTELSGSVEAL
jgi:hypothetical protein